MNILCSRIAVFVQVPGYTGPETFCSATFSAGAVDRAVQWGEPVDDGCNSERPNLSVLGGRLSTIVQDFVTE